MSEELKAFKETPIEIPCLSPLRTFWEKATLLHAEHHRPREKSTPEKLSRHYYDIHMLSKASFAEQAMGDKKLLQDVIKNKTMFFPSAWANYGIIESEGIKLLPPQERFKDLENDYTQTREMMLFGNKPSFGALIEDIRSLEEKLNINGL